MAEDTSILYEIDESLRAEKLQRFWQRFGKLVLAGCASIILLTAGWVAWKNHMQEVYAKQTDILIQATTLAQAGKLNEAEPLFEQAQQGTQGFAVLAKLQHASALLAAGQNDKALALYTGIAKDSSRNMDMALRDFAALQASVITLNQHGTEDMAEAMDRGRPFAPIAQENKAARLLKDGKDKEARALLKPLAENNTSPMSEHARAMELSGSADGSAK